jgi:small subunit ribosomal protein S14
MVLGSNPNTLINNGDIIQLVEFMFCKYTAIGSSPIISKITNFMQKKIKKNIKQRLLFKHLEKKRLIIKIISNNFNLKKIIRWKIEQKWFNFDRNSSLTRIKNICILTGRSRSVYRFFKISRLQLRKLASTGSLPGISKYNW